MTCPHSKVELDDEIEIPPVGKVGRKPNQKYPFDEMRLQQSFHVPKTEERPEPAKSLASTVFAANKRYGTKRFIIRTVNTLDPKGPGARVFRVV